MYDGRGLGDKLKKREREDEELFFPKEQKEEEITGSV
jgi:hypothetical protein